MPSNDRAVSFIHRSIAASRRVSRMLYLLPFSPVRGIVRTLLARHVSTLLDVGCGAGHASEAIKLARKVYCIGVDLRLDSLSDAKRSQALDEAVFGDARHLPFRGKSFDAGVCVEVLEHLSKDSGLKLLNDLECICRAQVLVTTPVGFRREPPSQTGIPCMKHLAGWTPAELRELGICG